MNYLSHFLLILLLLPVLRETGGDCRILNVSSSAHKAGTFDLDNIQAQKSYDRMKFYGNSKLFQVKSDQSSDILWGFCELKPRNYVRMCAPAAVHS